MRTWIVYHCGRVLDVLARVDTTAAALTAALIREGYPTSIVVLPGRN